MKPANWRRPWTEADDAQLRELYPRTLAKDLATAFARSKQSIYARAELLGLRKDPAFVAETARINSRAPDHGGRRTRFQVGQQSPTKGLRGFTGLHPNTRRNWFKTGELNGRARNLVADVGSYRITTEGYLERKVSDEPGPSNRRWRAVHRMLWEEAHGPIPADHVVVFKGGQAITDLDRITLDTLELVSRSELMKRNSMHTIYPKAVARVVQLRGALTRQINKAKARNTNEHG